MPLFLIGIGLGDEKDMTLRGQNLIAIADKVYLEFYTSIMVSMQGSVISAEGAGISSIVLYGRDVCIANREFVEDAQMLLDEASKQKIALLVVGDPFSATTHCELYVRCIKQKINVEVVNNTSIITAVGCTGLQLYRFGAIISLCFWTATWKPHSWYSTLRQNLRCMYHTLVLLDINVREQTEKSLVRGSPIPEREYLPPRYMTASEGARQLLAVSREDPDLALGADTLVVVVSKLGTPHQKITRTRLEKLANLSPRNMDILGETLHSLIIPATLRDYEQEHLYEISELF